MHSIPEQRADKTRAMGAQLNTQIKIGKLDQTTYTSTNSTTRQTHIRLSELTTDKAGEILRRKRAIGSDRIATPHRWRLRGGGGHADADGVRKRGAGGGPRKGTWIWIVAARSARTAVARLRRSPPPPP